MTGNYDASFYLSGALIAASGLILYAMPCAVKHDVFKDASAVMNAKRPDIANKELEEQVVITEIETVI